MLNLPLRDHASNPTKPDEKDYHCLRGRFVCAIHIFWLLFFSSVPDSMSAPAGSNPTLSATTNNQKDIFTSVFLLFLLHKIQLLINRRDARAVEWDGLEHRCAGNGTVGSNFLTTEGSNFSHDRRE